MPPTGEPTLWPGTSGPTLACGRKAGPTSDSLPAPLPASRAPIRQLNAKVFVTPAAGEIAYFLGRQVLRLQADLVPQEKLHPQQTFIELYRGVSEDTASDILELEMHGPYVHLGPGESMRFEQTAEIRGYEGGADPEKHVAFLKGLPKPVESTPLLR